MRRGEASFRAALRRGRWRRLRLPRLTLSQWFRLALLVVGIVATLLGLEGEVIQRLIGVLIE